MGVRPDRAIMSAGVMLESISTTCTPPARSEVERERCGCD
jgi:hypothetical protein